MKIILCVIILGMIQITIAILSFVCYSPYYQTNEDKSMSTFIVNSIRRRERRRKLL